MKKLLMALAVAVFAVASISAKKLTAEQKTCIKTAQETRKTANDACKALKGKEKRTCRADAKKAFDESAKTCKTAAATPAAAQ